MPRLAFICAPHVGLVPQDDDATAFVAKHAGSSVSADIRLQRSPQHNRMFWSVANTAFDNLPERFSGDWSSPHDMVKGLQLAMGITDQIKKPTKGGWEIVHVPKSLDFGNMDQTDFSTVSDLLFRAMAHCLGCSVTDLVDGRISA